MPDKIAMFLGKPQINISCPSSSRMWLIFGCAFACVLQSSFGDGGKSLVIAFTALLTAVLTELLLTYRKSRITTIKDGSAAASAMILVLLLPNQIHPVYVFFGTAFSVAVIKYSFGGLGSNWFNPAIGGWLFIRYSWPSAFILGERHSSVTEITFSQDISALDYSISDFLNNSIFSTPGVQIPPGYIDLLFFNGPGIITDRGILALLIGTIVITAIGINRGWIPLVFLTVYILLIRFAGDINGLLWNGDMLYGFFSGGTITAAFILAAEPASGAKLRGGVLFTVILSSVLSWFFRYKCMEYTGCFIALALTNCFTPLVRVIEDKYFLSRSNRDRDGNRMSSDPVKVKEGLL
ncbi:MAG: RnfABCDGE type electron transport complex subunit D [Treponema sp.]|nr:RnfABCDGE type electron transport complex subunit D [Treponema sp.]